MRLGKIYSKIKKVDEFLSDQPASPIPCFSGGNVNLFPNPAGWESNATNFLRFYQMEIQMKTKLLSIVPIFLMIVLLTACGSNQVVENPPSTNQPATPPVSQNSSQPAYAEPSKDVTQPNAAMHSNTTSSNPAPVGTGVLVDNLKIVVIEKVRPADDLVAKGNMFTDTPVAGQEYMFVKISATCELAEDKQCNFDTYNFKTLGSDGIVKDFKQVTGVDGLVKYTTYNGGYTLTGILSFLVNKNDTKILLVYQPSSGDSAYLAIP